MELIETTDQPVLTDLDAPYSSSQFFSSEAMPGQSLSASRQKVQQWYLKHHAHHQLNDSGIQSMENSKLDCLRKVRALLQRGCGYPKWHNLRICHDLMSLSQTVICQLTKLLTHVKAPSVVSVNMIGKTHQASMDQLSGDEPVVSHLQQSTPQVPVETQNAKKVLPELIPLLEDNDAEVACRALEMVIHIAKLDAGQPFYEPIIDDSGLIHALTNAMHQNFDNKRILRLTLCALFHISNQPHGMQLILQFCTTTPTRATSRYADGLCRFVADLIECVCVSAESCFKYSLLILHNLMSNKSSSVSKRAVEFLREERALNVVAEWLAAEKNEKLLSVIVDIVQIVCDRNSEQKAFFIALNGPAMLCGILSWARYENLLWRATRLMKSVSNYDPQKIVDSGVYDALPLNMDHASQRLVIELLQCTRDLSDMSTTKLDISHLLSRLVQLLGTNDMHVRQLCLQSLANFSANNRRNKEFLYQLDILSTLKHVLFETETMLDERAVVPSNFAEVLEDIQENTLTAIRNLLSGHAYEPEVQQQILQMNGAEFFLCKLQQMRPTLVRKSLLILSKCATQDKNLPAFRHVYLKINSDTEINFAERLVYILYVSSCKWKQMKTVEKINLNELMHLTMLTMQRLCRDTVLMRQLVYYLKEHTITDNNCQQQLSSTLLPIFALCSKDDLLVQSAIDLLGELVNLPDVKTALSSAPYAISVLNDWLKCKTMMGTSAQKILNSLNSIQSFNHHDLQFPSDHRFYTEPTTPQNRNTRENSPCVPVIPMIKPLITSSPFHHNSQHHSHLNDSAYYSQQSDSIIDPVTDHHLLCAMLSPPDDYYSRMAERYGSMQINVGGAGEESSDTQKHIQHYQPLPSTMLNPLQQPFEDDDFYCDSRTEFYM